MTNADKQPLCRLLYAYELGLLEGDQLDEFEIHLLDCPDCRKEAGEFLPAAQLLKRDAEVRGLVEGLGQAEPASGPTRRRYVQTLVAIAAVVVFLVLRPWNFEFRPTHELIASENRLAVLYTGSPSETEDELALGGTLAGLLTADLSESQYIQVVSSQRLHDVARQLGLEGPEQISLDNASAIAHAVAARWLLTVRQATDRGQRRLITQLIDVDGGAVIASQTAGADTATTVFSLVDDLTVQLKSDLGLPSEALQERDPKVAEVTSHSIKAYELYLKGVEFTNMYYFSDARGFFHKALMLDSTLAMAYYYLAKQEASTYIDKAVEYSPRATRKEQMYIMALHALYEGERSQAIKLLETLTARYPDEKDAFFQLAQIYNTQRLTEKAIPYFQKVLEIDPQHRQAHNEMIYAYANMGRIDDALRTLDEYQRIAPKEANPWDTRGDILALAGRLEEAIAAYRRALEIYPPFQPPADKLVHALFHDGQVAEAEKELSLWEQGCPVDSCPYGSWARADLLTYGGQYRLALESLDKAITADKNGSSKYGGSANLAPLHAEKAQLLLEMNLPALEEIDEAIAIRHQINPEDKVSNRVTLVRALIQAGRIDEAAEVLVTMKSDRESAQDPQQLYWQGTGYLKLAQGDPEAAAACFEKAAGENSYRTDFAPQYLRGRALLAAGEAEQAVTVLESRVNCYSETRLKECVASATIHYYLAQAYEAAGHPEKAIPQYDHFLTIWKDADSTLPELTDARERLARLKTTP
jgi:tetratricopeptide (TPR) repeat protein